MVFSCPDKLNRVISYFFYFNRGGLLFHAPQDKEFCSLLIQFLFLFYLYPLPFYLFFKFLFRW